MRQLVLPSAELEDLARRSTGSIERGIEDFFLAEISASASKVDDQQRALSRMADRIRHTEALADILGRRRVFLEFDASVRLHPESPRILRELGIRMHYDKGEYLPSESPPMPNVSFHEALEDLVAREPRLAPAAKLVTEVYTREHGFALARALQVNVTEKVQEILKGVFERPVPRSAAIAEIGKAGLLQQARPFARAYAETVYRTNLATAYTAGRFQQATDPDVAQVMPAMQFVAIDDADVRRGRAEDHGENHFALHGLIAATSSPIWYRWSPPLGYNCRCSVRMKSIFELKRAGIIVTYQDAIPEPIVPATARSHPNFGRGRPDMALYYGKRTA